MSIKVLATIVIIAFLNVGVATNASAESLKTVRVRVGFDFRAGNKTFAAGEYFLETVRFGMKEALLIKGSGRNKNAAIIFANQVYADKSQPRKIVFARQGEYLTLSGVFIDGGEWGLSLPGPNKKNSDRSAPAGTIELMF